MKKTITFFILLSFTLAPVYTRANDEWKKYINDLSSIPLYDRARIADVPKSPPQTQAQLNALHYHKKLLLKDLKEVNSDISKGKFPPGSNALFQEEGVIKFKIKEINGHLNQATRIKSSNSSKKSSAISSVEPLIGVIKNTSVIGGCGCTFHPISTSGSTQFDQYVFFVDYSGRAHININGKDIELREKWRKQGDLGICSRNSCTYTASSIIATAYYHQTSKCPPEPTECEVNDYNVTITVEKNGLKQKIKATGSCGC
jgi:hypothetical protein